jgi:hypothetical protein
MLIHLGLGNATMASPNPHLRYAAAMRGGSSWRFGDEMVRALEVERCAVVRQGLAAALSHKVSNRGIDEKTIEGLLETIPEMAYFVEGGKCPASILDPFENLAVLALLSTETNGVKEPARVSRTTVAAELAYELRNRGGSRRLAEAFWSGVTTINVSFVADLSEVDVRRAIAILSPFEDRGLCRFYNLRDIGTLDEMYVFFRQVQFVQRRGAPS